MICSALWVRNGKCPVLREWSANDSEVDDFDNKEGDDDVSEENPEREFESRKHAAIEVSRLDFAMEGEWEKILHTLNEGEKSKCKSSHPML
jgi:hypothetical protein